MGVDFGRMLFCMIGESYPSFVDTACVLEDLG